MFASDRVVGCFSWEAMARVYFDVYLLVRQDDRIKQD